MTTFNIGMRKYVEYSKVHYWLVINAKPSEREQRQESSEIQVIKNKILINPRQLVNPWHWRIFIVCTVLINCVTIPSPLILPDKWSYTFMVVVHFGCLFYWIDFIIAIVLEVKERKNKTRFTMGGGLKLGLDAISLVPLSLSYMMIEPNPDKVIFTSLRFITVLRIHQVLTFFYNLTMSARNHWKFLVINHMLFYSVFAESFFCYVFTEVGNFSPILIKDWDKSIGSRVLVSWYFCLQTILTVGYGDITPVETSQRLICILVAILACSQLGIITGVLTTAFSNSDIRRESFRDDYEATMKILKERKIDKKTLERISDNMMAIWKYKKGIPGPIDIHILPTSLQKEVCFDINFGLLNRSLIFSTQPRSFLRSVSLFMKNISYLPGDTISEPFGLTDAMLCVASGVIEVVSEENDETVLFSLTTGTIIGEATLFISTPMRCIIRAATYVELQVLMKVHFSRLALKYPEIIRSMRSEIYYRLHFRDYSDLNNLDSVDSEFVELSRRKETKRFLQDLRKKKEKRADEKRHRFHTYKAAILGLYVLSENIPTSKTLPVTLIRARPWILRPGTPLLYLWSIFIVFVVTLVVYMYPIYAAFKRYTTPELRMFLVFVEAVYIVDLYIECTTAIENRDNFTFNTSIKEIIAYKLKTIGFYLDILATYDLSVFSNLKYFDNPDYTALLLSLNRVLKGWRIIAFFNRLEDNIKSVILLVRTIKYLFFFSAVVVWGASLMYIEACPSANCDRDRWFAEHKAKEAALEEPTPLTKWPFIISMYYSVVTVSGVSYGDIYPTALIDCVFDIIFFVIGIIMITVFMSQTSSTFKQMARVRSNYQSEVFAVDRFMSEHDIPKNLKEHVRNYLQLQWNYDKAFTLMNEGTKEGLLHQQRHIIMMELIKPFLTVPLFRTAGMDFLKLLARLSKVRLLPPDDVITDTGSPDREMFILEKGYCEVSTATETVVIGPTNPFGFYEMIVGIPLEIKVRTLTHARIITLNYNSYLRAVTKYPNVKIQIEDMIEKNYGEQTSGIETLGFRPLERNELEEEKVKKQKELLSKQFINVYKYNVSLSLNYWQPFTAWGKLRFFQFMFFPFVIAPNSLFIKIWCSLRMINVLLIGLVAPVYFSLPNHSQKLYVLFTSLQTFTVIDMYLMFHVAYYDKRGLLMFHPAKTVTWYLKGNFIIDLLTLFPYYWVVQTIFPPEDNTPSILYNGLGLIIVLQFYKFIQGCYYWQNDIMKKSEVVQVLKFVPLTVIVSNCTTGLMVLTECHGYKYMDAGNENENKLAAEWKASVNVYCSPNTGRNESENHQIFKMYLTTLYWVTQSMSGCGFGDISPHNKTTMIAIMIIIVVGIFLYGYVFADLTSGMITAYVLVSKYRRRIWEMSVYVEDKKVDPALHKRLVLHYEYNWQRTEGAKPQKIFARVHANLRQSIMARIYEATVNEVPEFVDVGKSIIRVIGQHLDEMYFLQGETIINYNDVQEHMYLLYRGKVELLSKDGGLIGTMERGGLFGNVSNTPFSLSSVVVVAAKNVDVLRLNCKTFFKALQISPNTKSLLDFLTAKKRDYIVPMANETEFDYRRGLNSLNVETVPYEITRIRAVRPSMHFSDVNLTTAQSSFHFKNSVFKVAGRRVCTFVILPETGLYNVIEIAVVLCAYTSSALTMYSFAFQHTTLAILLMSYALDAMFLVKFGLQYHLSYFDKFGDYVVDTKMIRKRYHKSKTLICDVISNLPLELLALTVPSDWKLPVLTILRLNRVLRLGFIFEYRRLKLQALMVNKTYLEFCWTLICTTLMLHFFTCLWFFVSCPLGKCYYPCFVSEMNVEDKKIEELYVVSMYYVVLIMTTLGFSGIPIYSTRELVLSVMMIISCRFVVVLLIGILAAAFKAQSEHLYIYQERISALKDNLNKQNLSEFQMAKMWNYVKSLWFYKSGRQIPKFITSAPYAMRCETMNKMFGSHLSQSYIFGELEAAFLRQLSIYLERFVYFPGNYIVQQGDIDHTMYFIHKGKVSVLTIHPDLMETIHFTLTENDNFGMTQGLVVGTAHQFSYRAETDVVILALTLSHWQHLLKYFPQAGQEIYRKLKATPTQKPK